MKLPLRSLGFIVLCSCIWIALLLLAVTRDHDGQSARGDSGLAERINDACGGWEVYDWTTGDEYTPVPAGTVKVTCIDKNQALHYVAVAR